MLASFPVARWDRIREVYSRWWDRQLDRPVINVCLDGVVPEIQKPDGTLFPLLSQYDPSVAADAIAEHWRYLLLSRKYLGDSYPMLLPDYGAGVNAAFSGCKARVTPETVWFVPEGYLPPDQLHIACNLTDSLFLRIQEVYRSVSHLFGGDAVLGMTHLNNGIDTVARFFDGVEMAMMLYDDPENLKRLIQENHHAMYGYFAALTEAMGAVPGYSCFSSIFADEPWMIAQSDFSYMIGPAHFEEFILPELVSCFRKSRYSFYHLDGPGQLVHLDRLCGIAELRGIQWGPGDGAPLETEWPEVYRKISRAGKNIWLTGAIENIEIVAEQIGTTKGIYWCGSYPLDQEDRVMKILERFGAS
jgi:hypothetical protein